MRRLLVLQLGVAGVAVVGGLVFLVAASGEDDPGDALERYGREEAKRYAARRAAAAQPAPPTPPEVRLGMPVAGNGVDAALVRERVEPALDRIEACWESAAGDMAGGGRMDVRVEIDEDGSVAWSAADGTMGMEIEDCVVGVVRTLRFPRPDVGRAVMVSVPIVFDPGA